MFTFLQGLDTESLCDPPSLHPGILPTTLTKKAEQRLRSYGKVYSSIILSSWKAETTQVVFQQINEHTKCGTYTGGSTVQAEVLFSCRKNGILIHAYKIDETWKRYAKRNKPDAERQILYNYVYMKYWDKK
jgi:hypothetical protein